MACALPAGTLPTQTRAVFLLDTSGSMRGIGDGRANIFGQVKQSVLNYVKAAQPDQLEIMTFDSGIRTRRSYDLPAAMPRFETDLSALSADGRNTHLYRSLEAALKPLQGADQYITNVYVMTDGIDNDRTRRVNAQQALSAFAKRGPLDSLTYIALGTDIPKDAADALRGSDYASGLTLPVGQAPDLVGGGLGTATATASDPAHIPAPFPDGTPLTLASAVRGLGLSAQTAQGGQTSLHAPARLPFGTPALLCAPPTPPAAGSTLIGARPHRVLLSLNFGQEGSGMRWLNSGADRALNPGETVTLRFFAAPNLDLSGPKVGVSLPAGTTGLDASLERESGARFFAVKLRNTGSQVAQVVTPRLILGTGRSVELPSVSVGTGTAPAGTPPSVLAPSSDSAEVSNSRFPAWLMVLLALSVLALGLLGFWWALRRARTPRPRPMPKVTGTAVPSVKGIQYGEDRLLALVSDSGEVSSVSTPLGGPFDVGMLARVPLLSGLRAEQHIDGLRILTIPSDIEVSQGARLLQVGDVIRPGTLLGVAVAEPARAPHAPLGSLVGLGLPLTFKTEGVTLHVCGPYGVHGLTVQAGITDLGAEFNAPALLGLKVGVSGPHILLADVPAGMTLQRVSAEGVLETAPLRAGTYLPPESRLTLPPL